MIKGVQITESTNKNLLNSFWLLDEEKNEVRSEEAEISTNDSNVKVYVIPTNEELVIARDTLNLVK